MALNFEAAWEVIYYRGPQVVVTSRRIDTAAGRYPVRELTGFRCVRDYAHPARTTALVTGAIEVMLAVPLALAYGTVLFLGVGLLVALGVAVAVLVDGKRNPWRMALCAVHRGRVVVLFNSRSRREFEQVRRAVIRAVEANRP